MADRWFSFGIGLLLSVSGKKNYPSKKSRKTLKTTSSKKKHQTTKSHHESYPIPLQNFKTKSSHLLTECPSVTRGLFQGQHLMDAQIHLLGEPLQLQIQLLDEETQLDWRVQRRRHVLEKPESCTTKTPKNTPRNSRLNGRRLQGSLV